MSDYFDLSPAGDMTIVKSGRTVFTTAGRLVTGLPSGYDYVATATLTYPDFANKRWIYNWRWTAGPYNFGTTPPNQNVNESGDSFISILPEETSSTTILAAAPSSLVNLFYPKIRINRTTAPNKTWLTNTIAVKPKTNVWIPYTGSVLLEEMAGMSRAFTLRIDGSSNLVLHQQQSVGKPPFWAKNAAGSTAHSMHYGVTTPGSSGGDGGEWTVQVEADGAGIPVYGGDTDATMHTNYSYNQTGGVNPGGFCERYTANAAAGSVAAPITDPTNYKSVYSIEIAGKFGRAA